MNIGPCHEHRSLPWTQVPAMNTGICHEHMSLPWTQVSAMNTCLCHKYRYLPWQTYGPFHEHRSLPRTHVLAMMSTGACYDWWIQFPAVNMSQQFVSGVDKWLRMQVRETNLIRSVVSPGLCDIDISVTATMHTWMNKHVCFKYLTHCVSEFHCDLKYYYCKYCTASIVYITILSENEFNKGHRKWHFVSKE